MSTISCSNRNQPSSPFLENLNMKQLLTLTLVAVISFAVVGCNKTSKVNASATAAQCDVSNCDPANCDMSKCQGMKEGCDKMGTDACPMGAAKAKPAAGGGAKSCCASKAKAKPAAAGACDPANCGDMKDCDPAKCASMGKKDGKMPAGCPMSGGK